MQTASYSNKSITVKKTDLYALSSLSLRGKRSSKVSQCLHAQVHKYGTTQAIQISTSTAEQKWLTVC